MKGCWSCKTLPLFAKSVRLSECSWTLLQSLSCREWFKPILSVLPIWLWSSWFFRAFRLKNWARIWLDRLIGTSPMQSTFGFDFFCVNLAFVFDGHCCHCTAAKCRFADQRCLNWSSSHCLSLVQLFFAGFAFLRVCLFLWMWTV